MTPEDTGSRIGDDWRRLSPWSMLQSVAKLVSFAVPLVLGAALASLDLMTAAAIIGVAALNVVLGYLFYRFRISDTAVEVRQGWLQRTHLELSFDRIQNIGIEEPFYFRLLGIVTLKIDSAGSATEEVRVAAIRRAEAESIRAFIKARRSGGEATSNEAGGGEATPTPTDDAELRFTRSLGDLVIHGITNNRAFIAIAGLFGLMSQTNLSPMDLVRRLGIDFDVMFAGMSMVRLAVLIVVAALLSIGLTALLSVLGSIMAYYGFAMYRTSNGILVKRGLLTRHEIHVEKSRIQSIALRQDWLDLLIGRRNVVFEPVAHGPAVSNPESAAAAQGKRILVPSVRLQETAAVTDEVLRVRPEALRYTPASKRPFYRFAIFFSIIYAMYAALPLSRQAWWFVAGVAVIWALHTALMFMNWKRKGLAIDGDIVVVRSGIIGVNYAIFQTVKLQRITRVQSLLMRRRKLSTLVFSTASTAARMPYLDTRFANSVMDYCLYTVEAGHKPG